MKNVAASIRGRLRALGSQRREDFTHLLVRYALERLLCRLSLSAHRGEFLLKGALLFELWLAKTHRATKDLDLLGHGAVDLSRLTTIFRDICAVPCPEDGLRFDPESVAGENRREDERVLIRVSVLT